MARGETWRGRGAGRGAGGGPHLQAATDRGPRRPAIASGEPSQLLAAAAGSGCSSPACASHRLERLTEMIGFSYPLWRLVPHKDLNSVGRSATVATASAIWVVTNRLGRGLPRASPRKSKEVWGRRWRQSRALAGLLRRRCAQPDCCSGLRARDAGFGVLWAPWGSSSGPALWGQPLAPVPAPTDSAHRGGIFEMSNSSNGCVFVHLFPEIPFSPGTNRGVRPGLPLPVCPWSNKLHTANS